jgi:hypothetical protein
MSENEIIPEPPEREPTATPTSVYGNNAAVACPCGKVVVVRSMGKPGQGAWECWCGRWYKGWPENGQRITHILVWESGNNTTVASYRVRADCPNQLDPTSTTIP